ncbi:MAG TPA: hypothetical protein PK263_06355 [bacterium]|nr:hypothetical protein [bacterium]
MYYYIFDTRKCRKRALVDDIKAHLSVLGITGEYAFSSNAYSIEELVRLGLSKGYNTIVGIGDVETANKIANIVCGRQEAMGIIPTETTHDLSEMIAAQTWKEACDNLRYRKIAETHIGKTANGSVFLTSVYLALNNPAELTIEFKDYLVKAKAKNFLVSNFHPQIKKIAPDFLDIVFQSIDPKTTTLAGRLSGLLGLNKKEDTQYSLFRARSIRLFTNSKVPLVSNDQIIAKTPQLIESSDEKIRLIVGRKHNQ